MLFSIFEIENEIFNFPGKSNEISSLGNSQALKSFFQAGINNPLVKFWCYYITVSSPCFQIFENNNVASKLQEITYNYLNNSITFNRDKYELKIPRLIQLFYPELVFSANKKTLLSFLIE